jgi:uncharacterized protein with NRDE domain
MCLIAFAWRASSRYRLLLAANRDEFHDRPALPAHWWDDVPTVYGGRDLNAGGTWLAISRHGKLAAVTNYRERPDRGPGERSRGELGASFVAGNHPATHHAQALHARADRYAGFNLLLFDWAGPEPACAYLSNRHPHAPIQEPAPGVHTLSNHLLNTRWPKSLRLGSVVGQVADDSDPIEPLFQALADQRPVNPEEVPTDADRTDPAVLTRTPFIFDARYGTRASTVVTVGHDGRVCFVERVWQWSPDGARCVGERRLQF